MPDDLSPETSTATETTAAPAAESTPTSADAIYDQAYQDTMVEQDTAPQPQAQEAVEQAPQQTQAPDQSKANQAFLSQGQLQVLGRAKIDPSMLSNMDPNGIALFVEQLRQGQVALDTMGAQLARLQSQIQPAQTQDPKANGQPKQPFRDRLKELSPKLVEAYDPEIQPLVDLIGELDERIEQAGQGGQLMQTMASLMTDMVLENAMDSHLKDYPSLSKPEARSKATERFWTEWNTGAYARDGVSLREQVRQAVENSVKMTFINTNEQTAAANLVQQNKARVAAQPKVGSTQTRAMPKTKEDIYNEAYAATIGAEMAAR